MNTFSRLMQIIFLISLFSLAAFCGFSQNITPKNISKQLTTQVNIRSIEVFPTAQKMFTIDNFGNGKLWDLKREVIIGEFSSSGPFSISISPDFKFFYSVNNNGILQKVKTKSGKIISSTNLESGEISKISVSKNGKWLYISGKYKIYKVSTRDLSFETQENLSAGDVLGKRQLTFSTSNQTYATPDNYNKKNTFIYEAMTKKEIAQIPISDRNITDFFFSPNGKFLAIKPFARFIEIHDAKTGKFLYRMDCEKGTQEEKKIYRTLTYRDQYGNFKLGTCVPPSDAFFSHDGKFIFEVISTGHIYKWDVEKGIILNTYKNKSGSINSNEPKPKDIYFKAVDVKRNTIYGNDNIGRLFKYNFKTQKISKISQPIIQVQNATYDKTKESIKVYTKDDNGSILKINTKTKSLQQQEHYFPNAKYLTYELTSDDRFALNEFGTTDRILFDSKTGEAYKLPYDSHIRGGGFGGKAIFSKDEKSFVAQTGIGIYYANLGIHLKPETHKEFKITHWKFTANQESIIYLTNSNNQPRLKKLNLKTKAVEVLWKSLDNSFEAIYFSYSPDKKKISINTRDLKNSRKTEIIILDQYLKEELFRWKEGGIYYADWLDNSTLINYSYKDFAVLDYKTKSTLKLQEKEKHYSSSEKKKQAVFSPLGDTFAAISLKDGNPLFIFDNFKKEFWDLDLPCFKNVNYIEMSEDGKELLIVFQKSIVARLDLENRKVITQYRFTKLNEKIILVEN